MKSEYEQTELIIALLKRIADKMDPDTSVSFADGQKIDANVRRLSEERPTEGTVRRNFHGSPFDEGDWQIHNDGKAGEDE